MRWSIIALLWVYSLSLQAITDIDQQQIQERIKPVGKVRVEDEAKTDTTIAKQAEKKAPGQQTYEQYCIVCHRDGLAGAPKFQNDADWKMRLSGKTIDELVVIVTRGLNAMPPKGTCVDCSDTDLKAAIQYMLPKS